MKTHADRKRKTRFLPLLFLPFIFLLAGVYSDVSANQNILIKLDAVPENAVKPDGLLWQDTHEFIPARKESYSFRFAVAEMSIVTLHVLGPDGDIVRTLHNKAKLSPGEYSAVWDGLDDDGMLVPDEAYVPRLEIERSDVAILDNPREYSGGEIIPNLDWIRRNDTQISYTLPQPARVLIRVGVDAGPMLREIMHWTPVASGKAVARWDGRDASGVNYFADRNDIWVVVMAYQLAEFAVITTGNDAIGYREYRSNKGWSSIDKTRLTDIDLQRRGNRLSPDYFLPRGYLPRVSLGFLETLPRSRFDIPIVGDELLLEVSVPKEDRWILDSTFYETGFYVNYQFKSEEEQGFVPLVWSLDTRSLPAGRHLATVQLFGFGGFIASDTVEFIVK